MTDDNLKKIKRISGAYLSQVESGTRDSFEKIKKGAAALNITVDDLA